MMMRFNAMVHRMMKSQEIADALLLKLRLRNPRRVADHVMIGHPPMAIYGTKTRQLDINNMVI